MAQIGIVTGRDANNNVLVKPPGGRKVVALEDSGRTRYFMRKAVLFADAGDENGSLVAGAYAPYAASGLRNLKN